MLDLFNILRHEATLENIDRGNAWWKKNLGYRTSKIHVNGLLILWLDMSKLEKSWESYNSRKKFPPSHMF